MLKVAIIIGSTRPGRNGEAVGKWVYEVASKRTDAAYELIDLLEVNLPFLDEPNPPAMQQYTKQHSKDWSARIMPFDAFVFVTPEYNHGVPAALKNALDFLYKEWNNKAAGFVAYGNAGGARSVEHLRCTMAELQMADVREQVALSLFTDFEHYSVFKPAAFQEKKLNALLDQLVSWGEALKQVREKQKNKA
ncbi:NADPH-dependent FMN reductase [Adhaeribacter soli]|uniref:NAD(P)H-dependent oxidoreductase n=1 Tax=Adhaeribacter soli TaxID=2607655 RepID=A0A5N1IRG9_9BACT|nr:NAD(P)H-dependent oxidoreductase [Adhaeribacter soli]KAA9327350.1 NAD(P)H-dependent oxidoreductase [Adhaeribacter soli]